jgi:hypothetical protein
LGLPEARVPAGVTSRFGAAEEARETPGPGADSRSAAGVFSLETTKNLRTTEKNFRAASGV